MIVKKIMLVFVILLVVSTFAYAKEKFTVSGIVTFPKEGAIYISLLTKEEWQKLTILSPPPRTIIITLNKEQKKTRKAAFKFVRILRGAYGIRVFQDVNNNGKLDRCPYGFPKEPCGFYKRAGETDWANITFEVDKDIDGIKVRLY
jgi:uncharacterized protein (DUF2141 family)